MKTAKHGSFRLNGKIVSGFALASNTKTTSNTVASPHLLNRGDGPAKNDLRIHSADGLPDVAFDIFASRGGETFTRAPL